jgi:hypothetical protein
VNCPHCGKEINPAYNVFLQWELQEQAYFCNRACLRAWLGPDRTTLHQNKPAPGPGLSPQYVVVPLARLRAISGEDGLGLVQTYDIRAVFTAG